MDIIYRETEVKVLVTKKNSKSEPEIVWTIERMRKENTRKNSSMCIITEEERNHQNKTVLAMKYKSLDKVDRKSKLFWYMKTMNIEKIWKIMEGDTP